MGNSGQEEVLVSIQRAHHVPLTLKIVGDRSITRMGHGP